MTLRSRPRSNRPHFWDDRDRRNFLMNVGFGLTVLVSLLLLALAFGLSWYGSHLASAATVNGQSITKDAYARQLKINEFRVEFATRRIRTLLTAGHLRATDAQARINAYGQISQNAPAVALEQLIDSIVLQQVAPVQGVSVADSDVQAHVTEEASTSESRHVWMIAVSPALASGQTTPSLLGKAEARHTAELALADLAAGKDWVTVAKATSTDSTKDTGGDLGFIDENSQLDRSFRDALMAAAKDAPTGVIEGSDGVYRIGRVTEIVAPETDATLQQQVEAAGISYADFMSVMRLETLHNKLSEAIVARLVAPAPQRKVAEIWMQEGASETGPSAIKVRHILYSPNGDPQLASKVAETDPAWAAAKAKADAAFSTLQAKPDLFDSIARAQSNEGLARTSGGKLPYFSTDDAIDPAFAAAIFANGLKEGQLLAPIKSTFGWHVIQVMHRPTDVEWANKLKVALGGGADFATLARDNSDRADADKGGDLGWVAKGILGLDVEDAIFAAPIGKVSDPLKVKSDGVYLFLVSAEETRPPDADQRAKIEGSGFSSWYNAQKATFTITRDPAISSANTGG
jgi:parvulin-like peptidyl-prolyl isomerase